MSQHMVVVLIIDIDPKITFNESTIEMIFMSTRTSPIRYYNDGVYLVDHLRS